MLVLEQDSGLSVASFGDLAVDPCSFANVAALGGYSQKVLRYSPSIYYMIAEASGASAIDSSGNGFDGTYTGITLGQVGIGDGKTSGLWEGGTDILKTPDISSVFDGDEFSIGMWVKVTQASDWETDWTRLVRWYTDASNSMDMSISATNGELFFNRKGGGTSNNVVGDGGSPTAWLHIGYASSRSGTSMVATIDGVQLDTDSPAVNYAGAETEITIGGTTTSWTGYIQHIAIKFGTPIWTVSDFLDMATV